MKPTILGSKFNPDQTQVIDLLKEALAQALEGHISSVAVIVVMKDGYATHVAGRQAADLYMGCGSLQNRIRQVVEDSGEQTIQRATSADAIKIIGKN